MAGTGKSTISRTVAQHFADKGELGASFFYKRGEGDCGNAALFFTTITFQLVQKFPSLAPHVRNAIEANPAISGQSMKDQFKYLILQPLEKLYDSLRNPPKILIVVDALDECDQEEDVKLIIYLLSQAKSLESVHLKFFVTSRPDLPIRLGFGDINGKYNDLILHEIPTAIIERDISVFLKYELSKFRNDYNRSNPQDRQLPPNWPGDTNVKSLVEMASPLFIFAATICLFIKSRRFPPEHQLTKILESGTKSQKSKLDATYLPVLNQLLVGLDTSQQRDLIAEFRETVGSIIILANPLSVASLSRLLGISKTKVDCTLDHLHSVLSIPSNSDAPVRLLHLSFRDFLLDSEKRDKPNEYPFWIDEKEAHKKLAVQCLKCLYSNNYLKRDICNIQVPGRLRTEIDKQTIDICLPVEAQYACQYWVYHLKESGTNACNNLVNNFLRRHFLHWLEALSLIGRASESVGLIGNLLSIIDVRCLLLSSANIY